MSPLLALLIRRGEETDEPIIVNEDSEALRFVVQWLRAGGCDSPNRYAIKYPAQSKRKLQQLHSLVDFLKICILLNRTTADLNALEQAEQEETIARDKQLGKDPKGACGRCGDPK